MLSSQKISFSLPKFDLKMLENERRRMGLGRSAFIDMTIRFWIDWMRKDQLIRCYEEGYRKVPERIRELKAIERAGMEVVALKEEW